MHWMKNIVPIAVLMAVPMFGDDIRLAEPHPIIGKPRQVVIGINQGDDKSIYHALTTAESLLKFYTPDKVHIEIVAYQDGIRVLLKKETALFPQVQGLQDNGVEFIAGGETLDSEKIHDASLIHNIRVVSSGAAEIVERSSEGAIYLQP